MGKSPDNLAISPDGTTAYVTLLHDGAVSVIDLTTGVRHREIGVNSGVNTPFAVAFTPDGLTAYATGYSLDAVVLTLTDAAGTSTRRVFTGHTMSRNGGLAATVTHMVSIG